MLNSSSNAITSSTVSKLSAPKSSIKLEFSVIGLVILVFPVLFIFASKNLDAKGVFDWMMDKPQDWIGKDKFIK